MINYCFYCKSKSGLGHVWLCVVDCCGKDCDFPQCHKRETFLSRPSVRDVWASSDIGWVLIDNIGILIPVVMVLLE